MSSSDLTKALADLVRANAARGPLPNFQQVKGLSDAILSQVPPQNPYQSSDQSSRQDVRGPSVINRILDVMSRPEYGVLNYAKGVLDRTKGQSLPERALNSTSFTNILPGLKDVWQGLSGKEKTTGSTIINDTFLGDRLDPVTKAISSFGLDVAADPLTYVGAGLVPKLGKAAKASTEALRGVEEGTGKTAQSLSEEISRRASRQATDLQVTVPKPGMPAPELRSPARVFQAGAGPNLAEDVTQQIPLPRSPIAELTATPSNLHLKGTGDYNLVEKALGDADKVRAPRTNPLLDLKTLNEQIAATKSPIIKNVLRKQAEKLQVGVKPADILSEARVSPSPFPEITIGSRWVDEAKNVAVKFLNNNRLKNINHVGQTNLYNSILHAASKVRKDRRPFHVLQMLRVAEDILKMNGRHLTDAEGISVRLSDLANMTGGPRALNPKLVDDFRKARPSQQIEDLKAFTTPQVVSEILDPVVKTGADIAEATKDLPPSQTVMIGNQLTKELGKIAENAGASSREAGTAKAFIDDLFNPDRDKLYSTVQQEARNLVRQSSTGIVDSTTLHKISEATYKVLGENPKILGRQLEQNKVVEGIMTKFATWWGAKDLKPFSREYIDTARNVASAFSETMTPLVRSTTPTQRKIAFSVAQGKVSAGSEAEQQLADQFSYMVQRLMGTHGITENAEAVVLRSGTVLKELNAELPKALKLIEGKGTDELGRAYDYTNGKWMHSWEQWNVNEPAESLYQLTRALQLVTRKNSMWDDAAIRWGLPQRGAEFQHEAVGIDRLKGTYFPQQIADQLTNLQKQLDRDVFKTPNKGIELFDKVQRIWKTGVTIYSPSHHIRNLNGDIYLAALDGVVSPRPYSIATKVLHAFPTRYKDMESVFNIMDPGLRESALRARPGNVVLTTKRGDKVTAEQLYQAAESQGLFIRAMHVEDLMGDSGGKVYGAASRTSELRDHWVRLAHFTDVLTKSNQPLRVAIEQAGRRVRKFHPDGMDMTGFEQNVLRRVIPFYSWMRKATPLVIEGAIMRPHITMAFPKAMADIQQATGIESQGPGNPFPVDQMFPDWLKEKGIGPILQPGSGLGRDETWRGKAPGYTIVNPSTPFLDQIAQLGSPTKTLLSGLSPVARIPIELATGQTSLGIPISNSEGGTPGYLAQQIPAVGIGARITGLTRDNEPYNPEQLINWLTALGVTGTGPYQPQAQTEIRQALTQVGKKNRGDYR